MTEETTEMLCGEGATVRVVRDLVEDYIKPEIVPITDPMTGDKALVIVQKGDVSRVRPDLFDGYRKAPYRRQGTATALDLDSFIDLTNRFKDTDTLIFADNDRRNPSAVTVFDYNRVGHDGEPRFGEHRVKHYFPLSDPWKDWKSYDGKSLEMKDFAAFLEDHIIDVLDPSEISLSPEQQRFVDRLGGEDRIATAARLMEVATGLRVIQNVESAQAVNLATGEAQMTFKTENATTQVKVPSLFAIATPVFVNGEAYQVLARLRYRASGGKVLFFYDLWRTDRVFDHAFTEALDKVREDTGVPVVLGYPEK